MPGLRLRDGTPTGGVFGFASIAIEIIKQLEPEYVAVAWDKRGSKSKRTEIFADYKAGRSKPPEEFYQQMPLLHDLLKSFGWPLYELDEYEADDIMGTFARIAEAQDVETCIVTGDYDMCQLISPDTTVYITKKGSELLEFNEAAFEEKYGVRVSQFVDYKALVGDKSDNIPGVTKIGPVAARKLLTQYGTLDGIYEHIDELKGAQKANLEHDKTNAYMSQKLADIFTDAPVELDWHAADIVNTDLEEVTRALQSLEFTSLIARLPEHMQIGGEVTARVPEGLEYEPWSDAVRTKCLMAEEMAVLYQEGSVYLTVDGELYTICTLKQYHELSCHVAPAVYGGSALCRALLDADIELPRTVFDIRQALFLLNPTRRMPTLADAVEYDVSDEGVKMFTLWDTYQHAKKELEKDEKLRRIAYEFDFPLVPILARMQWRGVTLDTQFLDTMRGELQTEVAKIEQDMYTMVGYEFNIGSPLQLSEVLFTKLQLPTKGIKKGKTSYSTGQKELDKLRGMHPIVELIERYRELTKLLNTYIDALPKLVDSADKIHTTFHQDVVATGRLSSTDPNLQNIPIRSELGRKVRQAFVASPGKVFVGADYSQFELRLAAVLAGDQPLIDAFNEGIDVHAKTASDVYGIPLDQVSKDQRRAAKVINFGILYGMSPHGLSVATGMSLMEAKTFIDQYFELRAPIRTYLDTIVAQAKEQGYVETHFGRRRPTPEVNASNYMVRQAGERAAANMPIQGTEADLMKRAMIAVDEKLGDLGEQILQVHDSILIECPKEHADAVATLLRETMEAVAPELPISLKVDVATGVHWNEL